MIERASDDKEKPKPPVASAATILTVDAEALAQLCSKTHIEYERWITDRSMRANDWLRLDKLIGSQPKVASLIETLGTANIPSTKQNVEDVNGIHPTVSTAAYATRENFTTQVMSTLFPEGQESVIITDVNGAEPGQALALQTLLRESLKLIDFKTCLLPVIRSVATYGTAFCAYEWVEECDEVAWKKKTTLSPSGKREYEYNKVTSYYAPKLTPIDIHTIVYDTTDTNLSRAKIIRKKIVYGQDLADNQNYADANVRWMQESLMVADTNIYQELSLASREQTQLYTELLGKSAVDVYEAWGDFYLNKKWYKNYVLEFTKSGQAVTDGKNAEQYVALRFEPNPYKTHQRPYFIVKLTEETGGFYPKSPLEHALPQLEAVSEVQNTVKAIAMAEANRPYMVDRSGLEQASIDRLKDPLTRGTVLWLTTGSSANNIFNRLKDDSGFAIQPLLGLMDLFQSQARLATGETEAMTGGSAPQYMKTGVALAYQQGAASRHSMYASTLEARLIVPLLRQTLEYFSQFLEKGKVITTLRGKIPITDEPKFADIATKITVNGASQTATQQLEANNLMQTMQMVVTTPLAQALGASTILRLFKTLLAKLNVPYVDDIVPESLIQTEGVVPRVSLFDRIGGMFWKPAGTPNTSDPQAQQQMPQQSPPPVPQGQPIA